RSDVVGTRQPAPGSTGPLVHASHLGGAVVLCRWPMRHAPTSPALVTAAAELLLLRCTDGPVGVAEALGASVAWVALGLVAARLDRRLATLPVVLWAVMLPIWRDGGPADASVATWVAAAALL